MNDGMGNSVNLNFTFNLHLNIKLLEMMALKLTKETHSFAVMGVYQLISFTPFLWSYLGFFRLVQFRILEAIFIRGLNRWTTLGLRPDDCLLLLILIVIVAQLAVDPINWR